MNPATALINDALDVAAVAHREQLGRDGHPYIMHVLRVATGLTVHTPEQVAIALLHDVLEDCPEWSIARLRQHGFPDSVLLPVAALTKKDGEDYMEYIKRVAQLPDAVAVKLSDLADHLRTDRVATLPNDNRQKYVLAFNYLSGIPR